jgi:uncharacterized protein YkwD
MSLPAALITNASAIVRRPVHQRLLHLLTVLAVVLASAFSAVALAPSAAAAGPPLTEFDKRMLSLVNNARTGAGLAPLKPAAGLVNLSLFWSTQMADGATNGELKHNPNAFKQTATFGASNRTTWGENVAKWSPASTSADQIFQAYWASPGHKANIMGASYRFVGIASVTGTKGVSFNTMTFTDKADGAGLTWAKNRYSDDVYAVSGTTRHAVTWDEWAAAGFPTPGATWTDYVHYPWSTSIYAVTFWPGQWQWDHMSYAQWVKAGHPQPRTAGWIAGSTVWKKANADALYVTDPENVTHQLNWDEWRAMEFRAPVVR